MAPGNYCVRCDSGMTSWVVWPNSDRQLGSSVLCDECALVLAVKQASTLCWWGRWRAELPMTAWWRRKLLMLRDSLRRWSCMMSVPWCLLWCRLRHCVDEDHDELCCPWRRDDVVSCWVNINGQLGSLVLCDECALVLAWVQAATLCWWGPWRAVCPEQALPMDERRLTEGLMFCASYIVECTCNCMAFRFSASLRRWPMRSLWKDAVLWQHVDWSIYMVGKLNWNSSCRVRYACSAAHDHVTITCHMTVVTECVMISSD